MSLDTVGTLLAAIANLLHESLQLLGESDSSLWGPDEHEQVRALEDALDEAKKDFQELAPLVKGQLYYQGDRRPESIAELHAIHAKFDLLAQNFRDWTAAGGPINPIWARETAALRKLLHRAQCRAVARIFALEQESQPRCLGAFLLHRRQRAWANQPCGPAAADAEEYKRRQLEELATCNTTGKFERFADGDVAFVCDFCDGYLVWPDLEAMPSIRAADEALAGSTNPIPPVPAGAGVEHWQATGFALSTREEKSVVFAPLAIGNHLAPEPGEWRARVVCPFCDDEYVLSQGDGEMEATRYGDEDRVLADLVAFQGHLEWYHTALPRPTFPSSRGSCTAM